MSESHFVDRNGNRLNIPENMRCVGQHGCCANIATHPYSGGNQNEPKLCWSCFIYDCSH